VVVLVVVMMMTMIHLKRTHAYYLIPIQSTLNFSVRTAEFLTVSVFVVVHVGAVDGKEAQNRTKIFDPNKDKRSSNIKFHKNPSNGSRAVPCVRTDGQL